MQCKKCAAMMEFKMTYSCGNPLIYYVCPCCGYDTRDDALTYATSTHTEPVSEWAYTNNSTISTVPPRYPL